MTNSNTLFANTTIKRYVAYTRSEEGIVYTHRLQVNDGVGVYWSDEPCPGVLHPSILTTDLVQSAMHEWGLNWTEVEHW